MPLMISSPARDSLSRDLSREPTGCLDCLPLASCRKICRSTTRIKGLYGPLFVTKDKTDCPIHAQLRFAWQRRETFHQSALRECKRGSWRSDHFRLKAGFLGG